MSTNNMDRFEFRCITGGDTAGDRDRADLFPAK